MVFYREEDREYDVNELGLLSDKLPPVPAMLPDGLVEPNDVRSQETGPFLRDVFGYGGANPNDNQIGRFVAEALGVETRLGVSFLLISETAPPQSGSRRSAVRLQKTGCFGRAWIRGLAH